MHPDEKAVEKTSWNHSNTYVHTFSLLPSLIFPAPSQAPKISRVSNKFSKWQGLFLFSPNQHNTIISWCNMSVKYVDLDVEEKLEEGSPTLLHHLPLPWLESKGYRGPHIRFHVKKWVATFDPSRPQPSLPIPPISSSLFCNINLGATHDRKW